MSETLNVRFHCEDVSQVLSIKQELDSWTVARVEYVDPAPAVSAQFKLRVDETNPQHQRVTVFVGRTGRTMANAGTLVLQHDEYAALRAALAQHPKGEPQC